MAGISDEGGLLYGGAVPFRSHQGLIQRAAARSDEFVLQIDPVDGGLDRELGGPCRQVHRLRNVAQEIDKEAKFQNDMLNQLVFILLFLP
ncbi:Protein kinase domain-containing protein [Psidium guajava]|nr:Protein kinase domain-containing protein [Psidium guajava]